MSARPEDKKLVVNGEVFWQASGPGRGMNARVFGYTAVAGECLCGFISEGAYVTAETPGTRIPPGQVTLIRSEDNGRTWRSEADFSVPTDTPDGVKTDQLTAIFLDAQNDVLLRFYSRWFIKDGKFSGGGASDRKRNIRQYYQISRDGGRTWEQEQALIQKGKEFDETHWAKGILYGRNGGKSVSFPVQISNGSILLPFVIWPWDEEKQEISLSNHMQSGVLIGTWQEDLSRLYWELGEYIRPKTLDPDQSNLVGITPAELNNGSILGIMSGFSGTWPIKYASISKDGGWTWSDPEPLLFDDGAPLFSPASMHRLIRSSSNGKLYWIGNILDSKEELYADDPSRPRKRLQIAEVNEDKLAINRRTVTFIDAQKEGGMDWQLSNFDVYEDRRSGNFILTLGRSYAPIRNSAAGAPVTSAADPDRSSDAYRYHIEV